MGVIDDRVIGAKFWIVGRETVIWGRISAFNGPLDKSICVPISAVPAAIILLLSLLFQ